MWYVVQVIGGQEDAAVLKIQNRQKEVHPTF